MSKNYTCPVCGRLVVGLDELSECINKHREHDREVEMLRTRLQAVENDIVEILRELAKQKNIRKEIISELMQKDLPWIKMVNQKQKKEPETFEEFLNKYHM